MSKNFNQPLGGNEMPRYAGPGTMFRLPSQASAKGLDVAIAGIGLDIGTSNRTGARFGPRQIRTESAMVRPYCMATGAAPFDSFQIADVGDVALNSFDLLMSIDIIESFYDDILSHGAKPATLGGDVFACWCAHAAAATERRRNDLSGRGQGVSCRNGKTLSSGNRTAGQ